ncbi:MAG: hypothetical protein M0Z79_10210 [Nitrospiraceae bacterium]|nr:hypothetical protein [Nitrospiraceae bacterium]
MRILKHVYKKYSALFFLLVMATACATAGFWAGEPKNGLPLPDKPRMEEVHTIAVPPFYGDTVQWRELAQEILASTGPRLGVIPLQKVDSATAQIQKKELAGAGPDSRADILVRMGRQLHADAVVNGIVLWKEKPELIIQVISCRDGGVVFWQSADFSIKEGPSAQGQRELLSSMLAPVKENAGKREKPGPPPPPQPKVESGPRPEPRQDPDTQQGNETHTKSEKKTKADKRKKGSKPSPSTEDVGPM